MSSNTTSSSAASDADEKFVRHLAITLPAFVPDQNIKPLISALAPGIRNFADALAKEAAQEAGLLGIKGCLKAYHGAKMGQAVFDILTRRADKSNYALVDGAVTRQAISKAANKLRKGFGLPMECPGRARHGRTAANKGKGDSE